MRCSQPAKGEWSSSGLRAPKGQESRAWLSTFMRMLGARSSVKCNPGMGHLQAGNGLNAAELPEKERLVRRILEALPPAAEGGREPLDSPVARSKEWS
jgi:hypothetical protein